MNIPAITPGQRIHYWTVIAIDGRRITAQCRCRQIRIVAIEDLLAGVCTSCGCSTPSVAKNQATHAERQERQRRKNFSWRLERGR